MPWLISQGKRNLLPVQATEGKGSGRASGHGFFLLLIPEWGYRCQGPCQCWVRWCQIWKHSPIFAAPFPLLLGRGHVIIPEEFTLIIYVFALKGIFIKYWALMNFEQISFSAMIQLNPDKQTSSLPRALWTSWLQPCFRKACFPAAHPDSDWVIHLSGLFSKSGPGSIIPNPFLTSTSSTLFRGARFSLSSGSTLRSGTA